MSRTSAETLVVHALRGVLVVVLTGSVVVQLGLAWTVASGADPEDGSARLTALRWIVLVGMTTVEVAVVCIWRLATMVQRGTAISHAAFGHLGVLVWAIVAAALLWFAVTILNAPGQRDDPGVTAIMAGIGVGILGVALVVLVARTALTQAIDLASTAAARSDSTDAA